MVIGYVIDHYGYEITWLSVITFSVIASIGFYIMAFKHKQSEVMTIN